MKGDNIICMLAPLRQYTTTPTHLFGLCTRLCSSSAPAADIKNDTYSDQRPMEPEKFRVLQLTRAKFDRKPRENQNLQYFRQPRADRQPVTQDWGNTWPGPRMFHPASIPLPVRMGYPFKNNPSPDKWANVELMKIPNFFHLTPPVIKRQCEAIKKFCTDWPEGLDTDEEQTREFPVTVTISQYLHASPTLRDPRARVVTLKVPLDSLALDTHGKDKLLRLVGPRYNQKDGILTITADRCPVSKQNFEYCIYLLTVIYNESMKQEPWEHEKRLEDSPYMIWEDSPSVTKIQFLEEELGLKIEDEAKEAYKDVILKLHNEGEDEQNIQLYKEAVLNLVHFK